MLLAISQTVYTDLSSNASLKDLLSKDASGIRPLIAEFEDGEKFITYQVNYEGFSTKDRMANYNLIIRCFAPTYNASVQIADAVTTALEQSTNYYEYISAKPIFDEQNIIYTEQIFNLKK